MYTVVELITPEIAKEYLKRNTKNRKIKKGAVTRYANDMRAGKWQLTPQGISFHENGSLGDGQHRLLAVIESDTPTLMNVTYDVPNDVTLFDRGVVRSTPDILTLNGLDPDVANNSVVGCVNFLFCNAKGRTPTESIVSDFCEENREYLVKANRVVLSGNGDRLCTKAPVIAAAFCALYSGLSEEGLRDFFNVVNTGFYSGGGKTSAIVLRNYITREYGKNTWEQRRLLFEMTTLAIHDFARGVGRTKKYKLGTTPMFWRFVKRNAIDKYAVS